MTKRFTVLSLVAAFVVGLVGGAVAWDRIDDDAQGSRDRSSQARSRRIGPDADLLDVVKVVESLPQVKPCRMVEMYRYSPPTVRAFCSTTVGDEIRIVHHNDPSAQEADIAAFCDLGDGQAFIPPDERWSLYQVPGNTSAGADPGLTNELADALAVETVECG